MHQQSMIRFILILSVSLIVPTRAQETTSEAVSVPAVEQNPPQDTRPIIIVTKKPEPVVTPVPTIAPELVSEASFCGQMACFSSPDPEPKNVSLILGILPKTPTTPGMWSLALGTTPVNTGFGGISLMGSKSLWMGPVSKWYQQRVKINVLVSASEETTTGAAAISSSIDIKALRYATLELGIGWHALWLYTRHGLSAKTGVFFEEILHGRFFTNPATSLFTGVQLYLDQTASNTLFAHIALLFGVESSWGD